MHLDFNNLSDRLNKEDKKKVNDINKILLKLRDLQKISMIDKTIYTNAINIYFRRNELDQLINDCKDLEDYEENVELWTYEKDDLDVAYIIIEQQLALKEDLTKFITDYIKEDQKKTKIRKERVKKFNNDEQMKKDIESYYYSLDDENKEKVKLYNFIYEKALEQKEIKEIDLITFKIVSLINVYVKYESIKLGIDIDDKDVSSVLREEESLKQPIKYYDYFNEVKDDIYLDVFNRILLDTLEMFRNG